MKRISWRYLLAFLAALAILVYLAAPYLGWRWGVDTYIQRTTGFYATEDAAVLARVAWTDGIVAEVPEAIAPYTLELNYRDPWSDPEAELSILPAGGRALITVETWSAGGTTRGDNPLRDVTEGQYDTLFAQFLTALPDAGRDILLRFDPNMEVPAGVLPWQQLPEPYIAAYRRFALAARRLAPRARLLWSPAGYPGALEYYPGDDVVDAAAVTYRYPGERELNTYPREPDDGQDLYRRLHRLRFLRVPVYVLRQAETPEPDPDLQAVLDRLVAAPEGTYGIMTDTARATRPRGPGLVGVYDPGARLVDDGVVGGEHLYTDFGDLRSGHFDSAFQQVGERGHRAIVTLGPYAAEGEDALTAVCAGAYDDALLRLYRTLGTAELPVYLRYAQEMEQTGEERPWQGRDPAVYIRSYRYVMDHDSLPANVTRIWGPAGERGALEYYPGDAVTDAVSVSVYGTPAEIVGDPRDPEDFEAIFRRKMWRLRFVSKPVFITECGVRGTERFQRDWLLAAARTLRDDDRIVGVNYFNTSDVPGNVSGERAADWRISRATLDTFAVALRAAAGDRYTE